MFNKFQIEQDLALLDKWAACSQPWSEKTLAVVQRKVNGVWRNVERLRAFAYSKNSRVTSLVLKTAATYCAVLEPICEELRVWPEDS